MSELALDPTALDAIARRFAHERTGFRLVSAVAVGLPVFKLRVRVVVQTEKALPPLHEFVLLAVEGGLATLQEVRGFLGLDDRIVRRTLAELTSMELVMLAAPSGERHQRLALLEKGKTALRDASLIGPEEHSLPALLYDGLLRIPVSGEVSHLFKPSELRRADRVEVPAFPAAKPEATELSIPAIARVVRFARSRGVKRRDILAVRYIERADRLFLPATALLYQSTMGQEPQVAFAIGDRLSESHEKAFARADGPRQMGFVQRIMASPRITEEVRRLVPAEVLDDAPEESVVAPLEQRLNAAEAKLRDAERASEEAVSDAEKIEAEEKAESAKSEMHQAAEALERLPVRFITTYQHPPLLDMAFRETKQRLLIVSPWVRAAVMTPQRLRQLQVLLLREKAQVYMGWGITERGNEKPLSADDQAVIAQLKQIAAAHPNQFRFEKLGDTHEKVLAVDRRFVAVGSFNWLSFAGDARRPHVAEQSVLLCDPQVVDERFDYHLRQMSLSPTARAQEARKADSVSPTAIREAATPPAGVIVCIQEGENEKREFKSTLRWNVREGKQDEQMTIAVIKAVAAFLNSKDGGTLFIGVADDGSITGTELDQFENDDKFLHHLHQKLSATIGEHATAAFVRSSMHTVEAKRVCEVHCSPADSPVFLKLKGTEEFYIRSGPRSIPLAPSELLKYNASRFR